MTLPQLGVGMVLLPGLEATVDTVSHICNVIEVEPQPFWIRRGIDTAGSGGDFCLDEQAFNRIQDYKRPTLVHSVGYPVGGSAPGDFRQVRALRETFARLKPAWWSEHMSFLAVGSGVERRHTGFLMPPVQSGANISSIVDRIKSLQDSFGIPFAFETGVNYLQPLASEIPDGIFWAEIALRSDCGILLDLHNIWTNERNGRQSVDEVIDQLPLDRIWEIHIAGGQKHKNYWLDSHSGLPPAELMAFASELIPRLPQLGAMIFEFIPDYLFRGDFDTLDLTRCLTAMRAIWALRGSATGEESTLPNDDDVWSTNTGILPEPAGWEELLLEAIANPKSVRPTPFDNDQGLEIYRDLIATIRRGTIAETLPLSTRYLLLAVGKSDLERLFQTFWQAKSPQPFMADEASAFADFTADHTVLPHIHELLAFETAAHRAAVTGKPQHVRFTCDPQRLIQPLKSGSLPGELPRVDTEVEIRPPLPR